jgi:hypothetical protein
MSVKTLNTHISDSILSYRQPTNHLNTHISNVALDESEEYA